MVISCQVQRLARKAAKIGFSVFNSFKKKALYLMGCLCSKGAKEDVNAASETNRTTPSTKDASTAAVVGSTKIDANIDENRTNGGGDSSSQKDGGKPKVVALGVRISNGDDPELIKGLSDGEPVAWPAWLVAVAPKAVEGWLPQRPDSFEKLAKIGQGTYSTVFKARDLDSGTIVALKKVRFVNMDPESVRFMAREIQILRRLDHPNVIKLLGVVASRASQSLYLVFEYMEHDLAGVVAMPGLKLTEPQIKCFVQQLLHGLDHCHRNGVLHRDIKGANLLIDSNGVLKIADFGLAVSYDPGNPQPMTGRVVTLWYRPPELLLGATKYGVAVDMWSTGCIVAELFAGKPIMPGRTEVEQIHKIFKLCGSPSDSYCKKSKVPETAMFKPQQQYRRCVAETFKDFTPSAVLLIDSLLSLEPEARGTASSALQSDFFRTEPLACDPSGLPKLPPSKEFDVRLRQEEARRQKKMALGGRGAESVKPGNPNHVTTRALNVSTEMKLLPGGDMVPLAASAQGNGCESTWDDRPAVPSRSCISLRVAARKKVSSHSNIPQFSAMDARNAMDDISSHGRSRATDDGHTPSENKGQEAKDAMSNGRKYKRIHYSGPLVPPRGNMEDMLKEHERHIQEAVRKARVGKGQQVAPRS